MNEKENLKKYVVNGILCNNLEQNELLRLINLLPDQPQLNENQQIVLEQLYLIYTKQIYKSSLQAIYIFIKNGMSDAYLNLDRNEASQVLQAFSQLALEQEEE